MKKIFLLSALALAMGFTSCDNYEEPNPPAQSNPQLSILQTDQVNVTGTLVPGETYNLNNYNNNSESVLVGTIKCDVLPEGYEFAALVQASVDGFATYFTVPSSVVPVEESDVYNIYVSPDDLNGTYAENVTKDPALVAMDFRFNVLTQTGNQIAYVGGPTNYYGSCKVNVQPFEADHVIEDAYYFVGTGCDWVVAQAEKFNQVVPGNPYDSPVFTIVFDVTNDQAAAGYEWKVIPQSTYAASNMNGMTNYGAKPYANGVDGQLVVDGPNGVVATAGRYLITIDMESLTYKIQSALEYLSVPFNTSNTSTNITDTQWNNFLRLYTEDFVHYSGTVRLYNNWFLSAKPAMDGIYFMKGGEPDTDEETGVTTGTLMQYAEYKLDNRFTGISNGLYYMNVNLVDLTYEFTNIKAISIIGEFNDWNLETAKDLTHSSAASQITKWSVSGVHMEAGQQYKFCVNHDWTLSYGGEENNIVQNGGNLTIPETGDYDFTLDFSVQPNVLTVTKK